MAQEEFTELSQLYKSWTTEQLKGAFNHGEDYRPEAITLIQQELATRKVIPVPDTAATEVRADGVYVKLKRERIQFPPHCPQCLRPAQVELQIRSTEQVSENYIIYRRLRYVTVSIPFCKDCAKKCNQTWKVWLVCVFGFLGLTALTSFLSSVARVPEVGLTSAWVIGVILIIAIYFRVARRNPVDAVSIPSFDETSITFKILNRKWADKFAERNNLAALTKN